MSGRLWVGVDGNVGRILKIGVVYKSFSLYLGTPDNKLN